VSSRGRWWLGHKAETCKRRTDDTRYQCIASLIPSGAMGASELQCFLLAMQFIVQDTYPISGTHAKDRNTAASVGQLICRRISVCAYEKQCVIMLT